MATKLKSRAGTLKLSGWVDDQYFEASPIDYDTVEEGTETIMKQTLTVVDTDNWYQILLIKGDNELGENLFCGKIVYTVLQKLPDAQQYILVDRN